MKVYSANKQKILPIKTRRIHSIATNIMRFENSPENAVVSITFCDDAFIKKLNKNFRGIDKPTDVLSFPIKKETFKAKARVLGDVVISVETAVKQAKELKHSPELEIVFLLIHGLLHLHGYDHIKKADRKTMREREMLVYKFLAQNELKNFDNLSAPLIKRFCLPKSSTIYMR